MILKPFEAFYHLLSSIKNDLYDRHWLKSYQLSASIVSIGNLSFGGTGKTPFIQFIAENFQAQKKIVVVCRSYRTQATQPQKIDLSLNEAARLFGDEACLLQKKLPGCSVWSGPSKWQTAQAALKAEQPDLILLDDGFSHRRLRRSFDLVLFDATKMQKDYFRESLQSLRRADAVVLTKIEGADPQQVHLFKQMIEKKFPHLKDFIFESRMNVSGTVAVETPVFAFCGIAQPVSFRKALSTLRLQVCAFESYSDHQEYSLDLQKRLFNQFEALQKKHPGLVLITTEKDLVKINHPELLKHLKTLQYKVEMDPHEKEKLLEKIRSNL